jgi:hypothetical protein
LKILFIVPDFPPSVDGVGDYVYKLLQEFISFDNLDFEFTVLVAGNLRERSIIYNGIEIYFLKKKTSRCLSNFLLLKDFDLINLHYVGYGYAKRGAPLWLLFGLFNWKKTNKILITTFHELYAISRNPFTSSFWNQYLQRKICYFIYNISNYVITTNCVYKNILLKFKKYDITVLPVFSNIGELNKFISLKSRNRVLVVFGLAHSRSKIYTNYKNYIIDICNVLDINKIIDIGPKIELPNLINITIEEMGVIGETKISYILSTSYCGVLFNYDPLLFSKSGVFAAFASHGLLVFAINSSKNLETTNYINYNDKRWLDFSESELDLFARNLFDWYCLHNVKCQSLFLLNMFKNIYEHNK